MIDPIEDDIGRTVIYTGNKYPGGLTEEGVITSFNDAAVFVRYSSDNYSKATSREDLVWTTSFPKFHITQHTLSPLDFDDPDAGDIEVVKGVTIGDIRAWHDRIEALEAALRDVIRDIDEYESINNLAPSPGKTECWQSVANARAALDKDPGK